MKVVLASANRGKLAELGALLAPLGIELVAQTGLGIASAAETGATFVENAIAKARHAARVSGLPAIADDSGLMVDVLGGAPGILSARYAGERATDAENNARLLAALDGVTDRRAAFFCALVFMTGAGDPAPVVACARWAGTIVEQGRGGGGFGYDPLFLVPDRGSTAAELDDGTKNALSHRGQAGRALCAALAAR